MKQDIIILDSDSGDRVDLASSTAESRIIASRITDIERAIETVRKFNEEQHSTPQGPLQASLDLLKVYTSATPYLQKGSEKEKLLAAQVVEVAKKYNELVRQQKLPLTSISSLLKQFFLRIAGKRAYKPLIHHEIHIPHSATHLAVLSPYKITRKAQASEKILSVLQTVQRNSDADYSGPKQAELDLFRTKCLSLLSSETRISVTLEEALVLIKNCPISYTLEEGAYLLHDNILHLSLSVIPLPGITLELIGAFQRDPMHQNLVIPVKDSFQLISHVEQTGFCHPIQYLGFALHEKLLPSCILRPQMCPNYDNLLKKKQLLAEKILEGGPLYKKAKRLIAQKKELFNSSHELFVRIQGLLTALTIDTIEECPNWYETLSERSAQFCQDAFALPISRLQQEWLLNHNPRIPENPKLECTAIMQQVLHEAHNSTIYTFGMAGISLHLMQLSEHLHFDAEPLSKFEHALLISLLRQQLIFIYEIEELEEEDLYNHLKNTIEEETAIFNGTLPNDSYTQEAEEIALELYSYYKL